MQYRRFLGKVRNILVTKVETLCLNYFIVTLYHPYYFSLFYPTALNYTSYERTIPSDRKKIPGTVV